MLFIAGSVLFAFAESPVAVVANPVANALVVLGAGAAWAASRSLRRVRQRWWLLVVPPVVVGIATALDDPAGNPWAGGPVYLIGLALMMGLASRELWQAAREVPDERHETVYGMWARGLAVASGVFAAYTLGRCLALVLAGPESAVFRIPFGSEAATLVITALLVATSAGMTSLSAEQQSSELRQRATRDALTGLLNRGEFLRRAARELQRARREGTPTAVMIADLDHFKDINDRYGHRAGDEALQAFASACSDLLRRDDVVGRLGGEEFGFLLPGTTAADAQRVADRISERLRAHGRREGWPFTVSFGIAVAGPGEQVERSIEQADIALYQAKAEGRDRAVLYRGA